MPVKVMISWSAGAGKSSVIQYLIKKLGCETYDLWQVYRDRAVAKWLTIGEYDKFLEQHPEEDIALDNEFKRILEESTKDVIVSRRVWFHFLPNELSIRLDVNPEEGARRIFSQDRGKQEKKYASIEEAIHADEDRMKRVQIRLQKIYGVDFMDKNNYTKIISTDGKTIDETAQEIIDVIEQWKQKKPVS